jgi:hypothetical protein
MRRLGHGGHFGLSEFFAGDRNEYSQEKNRNRKQIKDGVVCQWCLAITTGVDFDFVIIFSG